MATNPQNFKADSVSIGSFPNSLTESQYGDLVLRDVWVPEGIRLRDFAAQNLSDKVDKVIGVTDGNITVFVSGGMGALGDSGLNITNVATNTNLFALSGQVQFINSELKAVSASIYSSYADGNFTNGDLVAGVLTVIHNMDSLIPGVVLFDNNSLSVLPDEITALSNNIVQISLNSFSPIPGTWKYSIRKSGYGEGVVNISGGGGGGSTDLTNVTTNIIPSITNTFSIGTSAKQWKDIFVYGSSLYIGGTKLNVISGALAVGTDPIVLRSQAVTNSDIIALSAEVKQLSSDVIALSAAVSNISGGGGDVSLSLLASTSAALSQTDSNNFSTLNSTISTVSGSIMTTIRTVSGQLNSSISDVNSSLQSVSGQLNSSINSVSSLLNTVSGQLSSSIVDISAALNSSINGVSSTLQSVSGQLNSSIQSNTALIVELSASNNLNASNISFISGNYAQKSLGYLNSFSYGTTNYILNTPVTISGQGPGHYADYAINNGYKLSIPFSGQFNADSEYISMYFTLPLERSLGKFIWYPIADNEVVNPAAGGGDTAVRITVLGSNDYVSWTTIPLISSDNGSIISGGSIVQTSPLYGQKFFPTTFYSNNTTPYLYWRFDIDATWNNSYVVISGASTSCTSTVLTVSGGAHGFFDTNDWRGYRLHITSGTGAGLAARISSSTASTITFPALSATPDAISSFYISPPATVGVWAAELEGYDTIPTPYQPELIRVGPAVPIYTAVGNGVTGNFYSPEANITHNGRGWTTNSSVLPYEFNDGLSGRPAKQTDSTTPFAISASSRWNSGFDGWYAFDNDTTTTRWNSYQYTVCPHWISIDFGLTPKSFVSYKIMTTYASYPVEWEIQGWNGTSWVTVDTVSNFVTNGYRNEPYAYSDMFTIDNPGWFYKYRMYITKTSGVLDYVTIMDLLFYEASYNNTSNSVYATIPNTVPTSFQPNTLVVKDGYGNPILVDSAVTLSYSIDGGNNYYSASISSFKNLPANLFSNLSSGKLRFKIAPNGPQIISSIGLDCEQTTEIIPGDVVLYNGFSETHRLSNKSDSSTVSQITAYFEEKRKYITSGLAQAEDPVITDLSGGYCNISGCNVYLYSTPDFTGNLEKYTVPAGFNVGPFNGSGKYLAVDYLSGNPAYAVKDSYEANGSNIIVLYKLWWDGATMHHLTADAQGLGLANKISTMLSSTHPYSRAGSSGLMLSVPAASRNINVSSSYVFAGTIGIPVSTYSSSLSGNILTLVSISGGSISGSWSYNSSSSLYDITNYNPPEGLTPLTTSYYTVIWVYRSIGDVKEVFYVLGEAEYKKISDASLAKKRTDIPTLIQQHCVLVGRIITQQGNSTAISVESAFDTAFTGNAVINHNDTGNIQGGDLATNQYYHLTNTQHSDFIGKTEVASISAYLNTKPTYKTISFGAGDGVNAVISGAIPRTAYCSFDGVINSVIVTSDISGSLVLDLWKTASPNIPTVSNTITSTSKPTLSGSNYYFDNTLTGWTRNISAGDFIKCYIDSAATLKSFDMFITVQI
jgi:hypothetical protein